MGKILGGILLVLLIAILVWVLITAGGVARIFGIGIIIAAIIAIIFVAAGKT